MFGNVRSHGSGNHLIDRLPEKEALRLAACAQRVALPRGTILYRQNGPIAHVYFPTNGCCCHLVPLDRGRIVEASTIGKEGMVGIHRALGLEFSPCTVVSVVPCEALRLPARCFVEFLESDGTLDGLIRKYAAYCLSVASLTIACSAVHSIEQRVCRRLLMAHDRVGEDTFSLTQELLAQMLGVRRQSVTLAASALQAAQLIEYRRGTIKVLNRRGLEASGCECYKIAKAAYDSIVAH
jgi:CRP-like cAMP-binding protein